MLREYFPLLSAFIFLIASATSMAQHCNAVLEGTVVDSHTGAPVPYAEVYLKGSQTGAFTDENGYYRIAHICPGSYTVVCTHISCTHSEADIYIQAVTRKDILLEEHTFTIDHVVISSRRPGPRTSAPSDQVAGSTLARRQGGSLAETLEHLPGVHALQTGATIAKPVINGFHSNRILLLNNGVRQEGQQWGADHAPELDPYTAERITVIKGASSVRYGPDAMGGVILIDPPSLFAGDVPAHKVHLAANSNGGMTGGSAASGWKLNSRDTWRARLQGTARRSGNLASPDYYLSNTGLSESGLSAAAAMRSSRRSLDIYYSFYASRIGILRDAHIHNVQDLQTALQRGRPLSNGRFTYMIDRPMQRVSHHLLKLQYGWESARSDRFTLTLGTQYDDRREFDAHRPYNELLEGIANLILGLTTQNAELLTEIATYRYWTTTIGVQVQFQWATTARGRLIPAFQSQQGGLFALQRWRKPGFPLEAELGLRHDLRWVQLTESPRGADDLPRQFFSNPAASLGATYRLRENCTLMLHIGSAWRAPTANESFAHGVHHGTASYEIGNRNLRAERALNTALTLTAGKADQWNIQAESFYYRVYDYIYSRPDTVPTLTIRGAFPTFRFEQADSDLYGFNLGTQVRLLHGLWWQTSGSLLYGYNRAAEEPLIWIPPANITQTLSWRWRKHTPPIKDAELSISGAWVARQSRTPGTGDLAPPPPGYFLLSAELSGAFRLWKLDWQLSVKGGNLFDTAYRNYLNRLRYFADEPGRNISIRLNTFF